MPPFFSPWLFVTLTPNLCVSMSKLRDEVKMTRTDYRARDVLEKGIRKWGQEKLSFVTLTGVGMEYEYLRKRDREYAREECTVDSFAFVRAESSCRYKGEMVEDTSSHFTSDFALDYVAVPRYNRRLIPGLIRILRKKYGEIEYFAVRTNEGIGVYHMVMMAPYIYHKVLRGIWFDLTGYWSVCITEVDNFRGVVNEMTRQHKRVRYQRSKGWCD